MGPTYRCTYFLVVNGCLTRLTKFGSSPSQKSFGRGEVNGSLPLAVETAASPVGVLVCWAVAADANTSTSAKIMLFLISTFPPEWLNSTRPGTDSVRLRFCMQSAQSASP